MIELPSPSTDLSRPEYYINRELSWLDFNRRVMEEAQDTRNPLLERVHFLGIVASILDEFFEVRIAGLMQVRESGGGPTGPDGLTPDEQLRCIARCTHALVDSQYSCWNEELLPALAEERIFLHDIKDLHGEHLSFIHHYWREELEPILTPIVIDPAHPFPRVLNKALCIAVLLEQDGDTLVGVVTVPRVLPRILRLPDLDDGSVHMVTLSGIVGHHLSELYEGFEITGSAAFRITRNSELYVNEVEADNLLEEIAESLENRHKGDVVRLEIEAQAPEQLVTFLTRQFDLGDEQVFYASGPVNLNRITTIYDLVPRSDLKDAPFAPVELNLPKEPDRFFEALRRRDVLLHHPYESFSTVIDFIRMAVADPRVLAIKQTLYRTGEDSEVVQALIDAADQGKEVTALVELKARFDEAPNIEWAKQLEESGVHVVYGLLGMKTHCKLSLLVRRDRDRLRRYAHLGTGNYNHITARLYTDLGLLTAREDITSETAEVFNLLTARSEETFRKLLVAPTTMMSGMLRRIDHEVEHARAGRPAAIVAKMNGLTDPKIIKALYRASMAGVEIDLVVRGICCLRPGLPGVSERIRVYSIIGRFLEHSRVFYFANGGNPEIWVGSADWMNRNLRGRVEVVFPIEEPRIKERLHRFLQLCLADRYKARMCQADGSYARLNADGVPGLAVQDTLLELSRGVELNLDLPPLIGWNGAEANEIINTAVDESRARRA
ncbi:MAG: polyphosphate kinase 1 [Candidatus Latescibacterota bacterium]|nr:polyphosphate kinase 1 [Candidatus Latescibacterota bacterium]